MTGNETVEYTVNTIKEMLDATLISPTRSKFEDIRRTLSSLEYILLIDRSPAIPHPHTLAYHAKCNKCDCTSATEGVEMKNFAPEGTTVPLWLCKDHHPVPFFKTPTND